MKRTLFALISVAVLCGIVLAQTATPAPKSANNAALEGVLNDMDRAAANFRTAQADFVWDQYTKIVNDHDLQNGTVYYRRLSNEVQMAADVTQPAKKYVLFSDSKVDVYQPAIDQVTEYNTGKNRAEVESFLVLGFGGRGHDLAKSFAVSYGGTENAGGVQAAKLILVPKAAKVRSMFTQIILWIDPARGISVQQQLIDPDGNYRLAKYSNIKLNQKIADSVFKLKTTGKTKWMRPQQQGG